MICFIEFASQTDSIALPSEPVDPVRAAAELMKIQYRHFQSIPL
jgi:hypothetical protein